MTTEEKLKNAHEAIRLYQQCIDELRKELKAAYVGFFIMLASWLVLLIVLITK